MCWQCMSEELLFEEAGLTIIDRRPGNGYATITLMDSAGQIYYTNPNADWECVNNGPDGIFGLDPDGDPFLLESPNVAIY